LQTSLCLDLASVMN